MTYVSKNTVNKIVSSFKKEKVLADKVRMDQDKAIQLAVDEMVIACDKPKAEFMKGNARTNPARAEVAALFGALAEAGYISTASAKAYQNCFWIAFETGVPFSRSLHNKQSESKQSESKQSGKVESTTRAELDKTLCKALRQARLIGLTGFAAEMLDLCIESLDGFEEKPE